MMKPQPLPIYDVFLDIPHPATTTSSEANLYFPTTIIAPPPGAALEASMAVGKELVGDERGIARIARFAFPEFHDNAWEQEKAAKPVIPNSGAGLNKYDIYLSDFHSFTNSLTRIKKPNPYCTGSSYFTFAMQTTNGARIYGHVKRYLPHHGMTKGRIDVGRRAARALILLTRGSGGEQLFSSLLKTLEGISSLHASDGSKSHKSHQQTFLHKIFTEHQRLCTQYAAKTGQKDNTESNPDVMVVSGLEFGSRLHAMFDTSKYVVPATLLQPITEQDSVVSFSNYRLLPLLRCLGISGTLRLLSALLCERRIILLSKSPARLSGCARAALSVLAQGLLYWQHVFVPILPPGMITHLAAPMPYLVGLISTHASVIPRIPGIGEILVIFLDSGELETHNIQNPNSEIPDILRPAMETYIGEGEHREKYKSIAEILSHDLVDIIKADKKLRNSNEGAVAEKLGNAAGKGKVMLIKSWGKLKSTYGKKSSSINPPDINDDNVEQQEDSTPEPAPSFSDEMYAFTEGFNNESAEEEARIAFSSFFLSLIGDVRWYLRPPAQNGLDPTLDTNLFLQSRAQFGDMEGSGMYPLLTYFRESQLFEEFVKARITEIRMRKPVQADAPIFSLASNYLRTHRIECTALNVRRVVRQVCSNNPSRFLIQWNADVRRRVMALTSNSRQEHLVTGELNRLVFDCRNSSSALVEVMDVVWARLQDAKGMQWKHGLYGLQILRELLLHGPLAAVTEISDGIKVIQNLKLYENMRTNVVLQMRQFARIILQLLTDRSKLFSQRKAATDRRMQLRKDLPPKAKDTRIKVFMKFSDMHKLLAPYGAKVSPNGARLATVSSPNFSNSTSAVPVNDLLDFSGVGFTNAVGVTKSAPEQVTPKKDPLLDLFDLSGMNAAIHSGNTVPQQSLSKHNSTHVQNTALTPNHVLYGAQQRQIQNTAHLNLQVPIGQNNQIQNTVRPNQQVPIGQNNQVQNTVRLNQQVPYGQNNQIPHLQSNQVLYATNHQHQGQVRHGQIPQYSVQPLQQHLYPGNMPNSQPPTQRPHPPP